MSEDRVSLWHVIGVIEPGRVNQQIVLEKICLLEPPLSLDAAAHFLPGGAYTTFRTYQHNKTISLESHFRRLEETACLAGHPLNVDREMLRQALRKVITAYPASLELRLRLLIDLEAETGAIYLSAEPLHALVLEAYRDGVKLITCHFERPNPKAKLTTTMSVIDGLRQRLPSDVNEALMVNENGFILEGLSSNFFAVKDGMLWTAEEGVLSGITRQVVLEEARRAGLRICLQSVQVAELAVVEEAFITSSSRAVLPVHQVDSQIIGTGQPGPVTRLLARRYSDRIIDEAEPI